MARDVSTRRSNSLRLLDGAAIVVLTIFAVMIGFWALHFVVGLIWEAVKIGVILVVVAGAFWLLSSRRRKRL